MTAVQQIDIEVLADPESCQRTAAQLARLGQACVQVAGRLGRRAQVSEDDLGGLSGAAYRQSVAGAAETCDRLARRLRPPRRRVGGLCPRHRRRTPPDGAGARHRSAVADDLRLGDLESRPAARPADAALSQRWDAWHEAVGWWRQARDLEDLAEQRWLHVLGRAPAPDAPDPASRRRPDRTTTTPTRRAGTSHRRPAPTHRSHPSTTTNPSGRCWSRRPVTAPSRTTPPRPPRDECRAGPRAEGRARPASRRPGRCPINLPESWAVGTGLGSAGLLGGAGGRDPITHPEPTDPGPRDVQAAVR